MFCKWCGVPNDDDAAFCVDCGRSVADRTNPVAAPILQDRQDVPPPTSHEPLGTAPVGGASVGAHNRAIPILVVVVVALSLTLGGALLLGSREDADPQAGESGEVGMRTSEPGAEPVASYVESEVLTTDPSVDDPPLDVPPATDPAAAEPPVTDPLSDVPLGDGVLRLGGLVPETGNLNFLGPPIQAGIDVAVADINAAGGVRGAPVEFLAGDSGDNGVVANATVDRLLDASVDGFIGAASSFVSKTVIDKITQAGKVQFSSANTSPEFTDYADNDLYFRTAPSDAVQGAALADIMIADGNASATFLVLNDGYGTGLLEFTSGPFEAQGGAVDATNIYDPDEANFLSDAVAVAVEADSDAIVIVGFDETATILTGLIEAGIGPDAKFIYGTDGNMSSFLAEAFDDPTVLAGMRGTFPGVDVAGDFPDFRDRLLAVDPTLVDFSYSAESYDAVVVMSLAAIVAGSADGVAMGAEINDVTRGGEKCITFFDCAALLEADPATDIDYDGVSGPLEFRDEGEPTQASILVLEFNAGGEVQVVDSIQGSVQV